MLSLSRTLLVTASLATTGPLAACGDDKKEVPNDTAVGTDVTDTASGDDTSTTEDTATTEDTSTTEDTATTEDTSTTEDTATTEDTTSSDVTEPAAASYQVWTTDQGLSRIQVWEPREGDTFENVATIDYVALYPDNSDGPKPRTPHMVDFSRDGRYAFVAHTTSGHTTVIRTSDYSVVTVLATGAGTHMARVSPTGNVYIDVLGNADFPGRVLQLSADTENETFAVQRTLIIKDDTLFQQATRPSSSPVCGTSTPDDSHQFVTFGPGFGGAMLARIDNATFSIEHIYDPTVVRANCGSLVGPDGNYYFTGGRAATVDVPGIGVWYAIDGETLEPIPYGEDDAVERTTHGTDAHGIAFTKDGSELWLINRDSDNIAILDGATFELKENVENLFDGPDILDISPDGRFFFITLRGPNPRSGPHSIAGSTPGLAVVDIAEREVVTTLVDESDDPQNSDYHGLRVLVKPAAE
jgi:hypothetical protein